MLSYLSLLVLHVLALFVLVIPAYCFLLLSMLLGGNHADGGLAWVFYRIAECLSDVVGNLRNTLTAHKPVALTFKGAVRYWRKNLAIARDIDTKNWEYMADLKRSAIQKLPVGFDYGSKNANSFHKQFRFAKYVIGKRVKVSDTDQDQSVVLNA